MNYEEKIEELKRRVRQNAEKHNDELYRLRGINPQKARDNDVAMFAFIEVEKMIGEIFGASERSGVGENEQSKRVFCPKCNTHTIENHLDYFHCTKCDGYWEPDE